VILKDGKVEKLIPCGGGNKELFAYELVMLSGSCYVAVDSASHMGNGSLELYPLDHPEKATYSIDNIIDNHYEEMTLVDDNGREYTKSEVYEYGKLLPYYEDQNGDGFTDICFTGTKMFKEDNIEDLPNSSREESWKYSITYFYNEEMDRFIPGDEWEEFLKTDEEKFYDYTGYLDMNSKFMNDNPKKDYDGDGILDRVYKEYHDDTGTDIVTMQFGNGTKLQLSDTTLGIFFKTESADLTGDGENEILFEQYGMGTGGTYLYLSIFTLDGGSYVRMANPYEQMDAGSPNSGGMFSIPLELEQLDDTTVGIYQPDCGYQGQITTKEMLDEDGSIVNDIDHLYFQDMKDTVSTYGVSSVQLVEGDKNQSTLLFQSKLGDKWVIYYVYWKLKYIDSEWKITNVYQPTPVRIDLGKEYHTDLDGDQQDEVLCYDTKLEQKDTKEKEIPVFTVDGNIYDGVYLEKEYGISFTDCSHIGYYVMDIDINDSNKEIAILEESQNGTLLTYLFQYDGEQLRYCGNLPDIPENDSFLVDGDGTVRAQKPLSILQTWSATAEWKLDDNGSLQEQPQDFYDTYWSPKNVDQQNVAKNDLILFRNPEINQESIMIQKGETLYLTATDNKNWIQISDYEGHQGWFYLHDGTDITLPQGEGKIEDILTFLNVGE
jgi:hypothetical protein